MPFFLPGLSTLQPQLSLHFNLGKDQGNQLHSSNGQCHTDNVNNDFLPWPLEYEVIRQLFINVTVL